MPIIYFDNFRGFQNTFLDLKDVNFFVGENSTGKTSLLKLIGIIASQAFWRYGEFQTREISFGAFSDIITSPRNTKDYIEIGIFENETTSQIDSFSIRLKFIEKEKVPVLKEICYKTKFVNIQTIIEEKIIKYRFNLNQKVDLYNLDDFKNWIADNGLNNVSFSKMAAQYIGIIPILTQVINHISINGNNVSEIKSAFEIHLPSFVNQFAWMAPIRAEPQATYRNEGLVFSAEGRHSLSVLKEILVPEVKKILNRFGTDSGLYDNINTKDLVDIKELSDVKNIAGKMGASDIFEVIVTLNGQDRNLINVGYGISQVLPIIIEAIARQDNTWFAIQQPEVHLHPRAQAALGDFIFKTNSLDHQNFVIETHSDYIIDRYRLRLNRAYTEQDKNAKVGQIVFFSKSRTGNKLEVVELNEDGSYSEKQPKEFRDFFIREQLEIISI